MAYQSVSLERELFIKSIYTIHYYEYQNDFFLTENVMTSGNFSVLIQEPPRLLLTMAVIHCPVDRLSFIVPMNFIH